MLSRVPREIVFQILSWLPAVDVIRLKRTCKLWYRIVKDSSFIKLHLNRSHRDDNWFVIVPEYHCNFRSSQPDGQSVEIFTQLSSFGWIVMEEIGKTSRDFRFLVSSVCYDSGLICFIEIDMFEKFVLWNPLTNYCKSFTIDPILRAGGALPLKIGFGYDTVGDDYKVVEIVPSYENEKLVVSVFSVKNNSIGMAQEWPFDDVSDFSCQLCLNGALHWCKTCHDPKQELSQQLQMMKEEKIAPPDAIVSFDLSKEEFNVQHMPMTIFNNRSSCNCMRTGLTGLKGFLSVYVYYGHTHEVWIMKEYAKYESWTILYSIDKNSSSDLYSTPPNANMTSFTYGSWEPLLLSNRGDKVLLEFIKHGVSAIHCRYNSETETWETYTSSNHVWTFKGCFRSESYCLPGSLLLTDWDDLEEFIFVQRTRN